MNNAVTPHPEDEILLRSLDGDLSPEEVRMLELHLGACESCRQRSDRVRRTIDDYLQFHRTVLTAAAPPAPNPWKRLDFRPAPRTVRRLSAWSWLAAAAAIATAFFVVRRFQEPAGVQAAELLRKASLAERTSPPRVRAIRIRSGKYEFDRSARLSPGDRPSGNDAGRIEQLFDSAGYSWDDPLSADSFVRWHDRLPDKRDTVARRSGSDAYVIHTTTTASTITDASLTLRAGDLQAVACTIRFGAAEIVEMTELPGDGPVSSVPARTPPQPEPQPPPGAPASKTATPGEELLVIAALHRIHADLGEPIEVFREGGSITVNAAGVDANRQEEIRGALSAIPAVRLRLEPLEARGNSEVERRPAPQVDAANPLLAELQAASPDAGAMDRITEHTESMIERAYALRGLARRFSPETTAQMTESEKALLNGLIRDHAEAAAVSAANLTRFLSPILPRIAGPPGIGDSTWQDAALSITADVRRLDQALHSDTAPEDSPGRKHRAAQALASIDQRLTKLRSVGPQ